MEQPVEVNPPVAVVDRPAEVNGPREGEFEKALEGMVKLIAVCALAVMVLVFVGLGLELFFGRMDLTGAVKEVGGAVVIGAFVVVLGFLGVAALVGLYEVGGKTVQRFNSKKIGDTVDVLHTKARK